MSGKSAITPLRKLAAARMRGRVLDVGSGKGLWRMFLGSSQVVRLDIDAKSLQGNWGEKVVGSAAHLPFANSSFDSVWACAVVEHVAADTIPELIRVTKPGGRLAILTPNKHSPKDWLRRLAGRPTWIEREGHVRLYGVGELRKYGPVRGEIWGLPFLDPLFRLLPWLGDTILLEITVRKPDSPAS